MPNSIGSFKFTLAQGHRLQFEPAQKSYVLLFPEGMIKLNPSAAEILNRLDGAKRAGDLAQELSEKYQKESVASDVLDFLNMSYQKGWVQEMGHGN